MANRSRHLSTKADSSAFAGKTAYAAIAKQIRQSIDAGSLPEGTVLLEGPLAALFGSSRSPVKQALSSLERSGLLSRFEGRGLLVGTAGEPRRLKIMPSMLGFEKASGISPKSFAWQPLYYEFEREIILRSVFGRARVNELALARYLDVGRTVAHDLLIHAREVGIVSKDDRSRWWIIPLDEERFKDLYELRILLEPAALQSAIGRVPATQLDIVEQRLRDAIISFPLVTSPALDTLESDLHIDCVGYSGNFEIVEALKRTRCILVAGKHIQIALNRSTSVDPFMEEHLEIVSAVRREDSAAVKRALVNHLALSARKAAERLAAFVSIKSMSQLPYEM